MKRAGTWLLAVGIAAAALAGCRVDRGQLAQRLLQAGDAAAPAPAGELARAMQDVDDGARIVYVAMIEGKAELFSILPDGSRSIQLTSDRRYKSRPVWSPDHRQIAFFRHPGDRPVSDQVEIVKINANGSDEDVIVPSIRIEVDNTRLSWSTDGTRVYLQEKDFTSVLFGYDVASRRQVETIRLPEGSFLTHAHSLSPDGSAIAGTGPGPDGAGMHIGTVRRDGTRDTDLMKIFTRVPYHVGWVVWSYDGELVAYEMDNIIIVMSSYYRAGFRAQPLSPREPSAQLMGPAFSPSGRQLVYVQGVTGEGQLGTGDREVRSDLWISDIEGRSARQITRSGGCFDPHW